MKLATIFLGLGYLATTTTAILVAEGSPCGTTCGNVLDNTVSTDLACTSDEYSKSAGVVFKRCIQCELTSTYTNQEETDMRWLLHNLRQATSWCLFGFPNNTDWGVNPCMTRTACGPLQDSIQHDLVSKNGSALDFCSKWDPAQVSSCNQCLGTSEQFFGLRNFVTIMDAACLQMPEIGATISIEGDPFSTQQVNITDPVLTGDDDDATESSFTLGAVVGIAVGGTLFVLATIGFCIVWKGKKKRRAFLKELDTRPGMVPSGWPTPQSGDMFETPVSQKQLMGWTDSPLTPSEKHFPRYFSPYSSQYNSPVSGVEGPSHFQWPDKAQAQQMSIGIALGGVGDDQSTVREGSSKGKEREEREEYELREVDSMGNEYLPKAPQAPVLHHPGFGRGNPQRLDTHI